MSRLEELIQELCPNGVEYKRFDDVCTLHARIGWQRLTKAEYKDSGNYLLITGTDFTDSHEINYDTCVYVSEERYKQDSHIQIRNGDILITKDGTLGKVAQVKNLNMSATLNGGVFVVRSRDDSLDNRFILHYLLSGYFKKAVDRQKTGSTISHLTQGLFSRLLIPVPPLEVQREIVRILDNFTELTAKLTAKLIAELTARKQQYEYYRNKVLLPDNSLIYKSEQVELRKLVTVFRGEYITKKDEREGNIPVILGGQEPAYYISRANHIGEIVVVARSGVSAGFVSYWNEPIFVTDGFGYEANEELILPKYLYYTLKNMEKQLNSMKRGAGVPHVSGEALLSLKIPVPSLEKQKNIISVLDRFDALCNDLSSGLPAEIEARQKQYEYYRDKLLTFKEKTA